MPQMLGEVVEQALRVHPELQVVGRAPLASDPLAAAREARATVLVLCQTDPALEPIAELEGVAVFSLAADGREGALLTLHRHPIALDEAGLSQLPRFIAEHGTQG
ncbi:MAG: hypothetical protein RQ966_06220 [Acetobacteraceae bacterium]|nr:hypothetical protein [Acetobacteraceae bacterium]